MKRIYTKTGDWGMTRIRGGVQVPKDDIRIETNGTLDELADGLEAAYSLLSTKDFLRLSALARNVASLTAKQRQ